MGSAPVAVSLVLIGRTIVTICVKMEGMELPSSAHAVEHDFHDGLAYRTWMPETDPPWPGIVVLHGAGSCKENHADFARLAADFGWAVLAYDQRGHGESLGEMSPAALDDA